MSLKAPCNANPTKILTRGEISAVLAELARKAPRSPSTWMNLILFRLAACCGLRASEIAQLQVGDVRVELPRPHLRIRAGAAKGGRARIVPLWWDAGTLADLRDWRARRVEQGAGPQALLLANARRSTPLSRHTLRKRFRTACKVLGSERLATLTIHHGRHTFLSHALAGGRTLAEVRDAAGHTNITVTSAYLHAAVDDREHGTRIMSAKNSKRLQLMARRKEVAHLYTQGYTQMKIAERLGVSQATVSGDLKLIERQWRSDAVRDFDLCREHELEKLSLIEQEAWQAWERSQKPQQSADLSDDGSNRPSRKRIRNQYGDPRFLALVNQCIATRRALLGLDLLPASMESGLHAHISLEERRSQVVALITSLGQRPAIGPAGAAPGLNQPGDVRPTGN
jgi:site-specific recombinase XerD